jgi:two-component system phosphate regulon sensor histidine kinase PhoR
MHQQDHWLNEQLRLLAIAAFGAVVGMITGHFWICMAVAFAGYCVWLLKQAREVDLWLQRGAKRASAPDAIGVVGNIEKLVFRQRQSARERKKRLKKIVGWYNRSAAALPDATIITNASHEIVWANDAAERLLGIVSSRDAGQRIDNLIRSPAFQAYLPRRDADEELEMHSPRDRNITLAVRRVSYAENLVLFSARDVSARVRLRETRQAFVANASHELKTPLTVVNGHLELLEQDLELPERARQQIATAALHTRRMSEIVTDLLTLSKLENQDIDDNKAVAIDVAAIIHERIAQVHSDNADGRSIKFDIDPTVQLIGSAGQMKSLCSNLINNALQHTPPEAKISVSWQLTSSDGVALSVCDNGPGIPHQHLKHVTERFYRVDNAHSRATGGTGLGLSIVKHIVSGHNGTLQIQSTPGVKTSFVAEFPASRVHRVAIKQQQAAK